MIILEILGGFYLTIFTIVLLVICLVATDILPRKYQKWYLLHLLFMVFCIAVFLYY